MRGREHEDLVDHRGGAGEDVERQAELAGRSQGKSEDGERSWRCRVEIEVRQGGRGCELRSARLRRHALQQCRGLVREPLAQFATDLRNLVFAVHVRGDQERLAQSGVHDLTAGHCRLEHHVRPGDLWCRLLRRLAPRQVPPVHDRRQRGGFSS